MYYEAAVKFLVAMSLVLLLIPLLGGSIVWFLHKKAGIGDFKHGQCWRAFLIAFAYANILIIFAQWIPIASPGTPPEVMLVAGVVLLVGATTVIQAYILKSFTTSSLAIQCSAVVVATIAMFAFFVAITKVWPGG